MYKLGIIFIWMAFIFFSPLGYIQADGRWALYMLVTVFYAAGVLILAEITKEAFKN